ncbi:MAG: translocation/assembly module TamB domain-containing protein [Bacteroidota bacterium]
MSSSHITIAESTYTLTDENTTVPEILNFSHVNAVLEDFKIEGPEVNTVIKHLDFAWNNGLVINEIATNFSYTRNRMTFGNLAIRTSESEVRGSLTFDYNREDLADFINKVKVNADIAHAAIAFDDVNLFYNAFGKGKKVVFSSGFEGTLNTLRANDLYMTSGSTVVGGDFYFHHLFTEDIPFKIEATVNGVSSNYRELRTLFPGILENALPPSLEVLGQVTLNGQTVITPNTIDAGLDIYTALGNGYVDVMLKAINTIDRVTYEGDVSLQDFYLGKLINDTRLGKVSLDFNVEGQGFTQHTLNTEIIGKIFSIDYNAYRYKDIEVSGIVKDQLFDGVLHANDKNFKLDFKGLVDFSQEINTFNFTATVDHADLRKLNFVTRDSISIFKGALKMNMTGNTIDDVSGTIDFSKTTYINQNANYYFEDFKITSTFEEDERILEINSPDIITGYVKGKFYFDEVDKLIQNSIGSIYANYSPYDISSDQHMEFDLNVYNKIVEVFYPGIDFGKNTYIKGSMTADNGEFKLTFKSPQLNVFDVAFHDINLQIDNKNPLYNTYIKVDKATADLYTISDFSLINTKIKDTLFFRTEFKGGSNTADEYNLNFYHTFNENSNAVVGLKTSDITFKGNQWFLNKENNRKNKVVFNKTVDTIAIQDIVMNHENEQIQLAGTLIDSTSKDISLQFKEVSLNKITPDIDSLSLNGLVNGRLNILQTNNNYLPSSNLTISDFTVNSNTLGTLTTKITGKDNLSNYVVDVQLINQDIKSLDVQGNITVSGGSSKLDLQASLQELNLEMFSPLGGETISAIRGYASGEVAISGVPKNPDIKGALLLKNAGMKIPYLNVDLSLNEATAVTLYDQTFEFNNAILFDTQYNTQALFNGTISHTNFENWYLDLRLDTQEGRFLVLNTEESEEALYYGTGFMNGTGHIHGRTDRLNIVVNAATEAGTSLKIPISEVTDVGDVSFINFINKNEKDTLSIQKELAEYKGLELQFDLDVTPDAEVEIVIDKRSGSTLKGTGAGNLLIEINTNGKFRMWGDFITYTGTYNFKYGGVIDKRFKVLPGGTINWEGDPFNAAIDMKAVYSLYANPSVLLDSNNFTRKVATDVEIQLEGNLEQIDPDFDIRFPGMNSVTNSELQYRLEEKDKRQLQALSLLSQGTFISEVNISQQALTGNLIETASGLVNEILNDSDGKFDVGLSYEQGGRNPDSDLQIEDRLGVTISTQISDRILVNGKIGVPIGGVTETVVAGDVEVQVLLNEDGSLSAKIFNKENEIRQFLADQQGYTQGVGLSYQVEFDTFRELFRKIFKKSNKKQEKEKEPQQATGKGLINFSDKDKKKNTKS